MQLLNSNILRSVKTVKYSNKKAQDVVSCAFSVYGFDFRKGGATGRT